jgi:hypothetical protein
MKDNVLWKTFKNDLDYPFEGDFKSIQKEYDEEKNIIFELKKSV